MWVQIDIMLDVLAACAACALHYTTGYGFPSAIMAESSNAPFMPLFPLRNFPNVSCQF
tara:strand:+ start:439 stop:612 length:174 start_codon:yes stop_codon:yes gene_type:complete